MEALFLISVVVFMPQILKMIGWTIGMVLGLTIGILKVIK